MSPSSRRAWVEISSFAGADLRFVWSPSSRRAWVEITKSVTVVQNINVALLAEGVGRNWPCPISSIGWGVALLAEGVGRNSRPDKGPLREYGRPPRGWRG